MVAKMIFFLTELVDSLVMRLPASGIKI